MILPVSKAPKPPFKLSSSRPRLQSKATLAFGVAASAEVVAGTVYWLWLPLTKLPASALPVSSEALPASTIMPSMVYLV